ncbi:MAG: DUF3105 domain-containing protein [Chloroflexota bacterium]
MSKQKDKKLSKKEQRRLEKARQQRMSMIRTWIIPAIVVIGIIVFAVAQRTGLEEIEGVTRSASAPSNQHDVQSSYAFEDFPLPPMGGVHQPNWQNCGIYDSPVAPEFAIHSMEHGAVWITYNPELAGNEVSELEDVARGDNYLLLSPYPGQASPIVLTVWDRQLELTSATDEKIDDFIRAYRRQRGPERTATCINGIGLPTG